jgi:hypothetical protein
MVRSTEYQQVAQLLEINVMDPNPNPNQKKNTNVKEIFIFNKTNATYIFLDLTEGLLGSRTCLQLCNYFYFLCAFLDPDPTTTLI